MTNDEICREAIDEFGINFQYDMLIEECSELIQACVKVKRGMSTASLIEEIADVENMIMQIKYIIENKTRVNSGFKIDWNEFRNLKLKRFEQLLKLRKFEKISAPYRTGEKIEKEEGRIEDEKE